MTPISPEAQWSGQTYNIGRTRMELLRFCIAARDRQEKSQGEELQRSVIWNGQNVSMRRTVTIRITTKRVSKLRSAMVPRD
jgi:hypothetical protein